MPTVAHSYLPKAATASHHPLPPHCPPGAPSPSPSFVYLRRLPKFQSPDPYLGWGGGRPCIHMQLHWLFLVHLFPVILIPSPTRTPRSMERKPSPTSHLSAHALRTQFGRGARGAGPVPRGGGNSLAKTGRNGPGFAQAPQPAAGLILSSASPRAVSTCGSFHKSCPWRLEAGPAVFNRRLGV